MATDCFLKLAGIDGESLDPKFQKWIEIQSFTWRVSNESVRAGGGTGKVTIDNFTVTALVNAASPTIAKYCLTGKHIATAEIDCRKAGGDQEVYLKIILTDVIVSKYETKSGRHPTDAGQHPTVDLPIETYGFNFAKIEKLYGTQDEKGKVNSLDKKMSHDLKTNVN